MIKKLNILWLLLLVNCMAIPSKTKRPKGNYYQLNSGWVKNVDSNNQHYCVPEKFMNKVVQLHYDSLTRLTYDLGKPQNHQLSDSDKNVLMRILCDEINRTNVEPKTFSDIDLRDYTIQIIANTTTDNEIKVLMNLLCDRTVVASNMRVDKVLYARIRDGGSCFLKCEVNLSQKRTTGFWIN